MKIKHVVSVSSGKDSTATALLAIEKHPRDDLRFVFADTGNEHQSVYDYLEYLESKLNIKIETLRADFSRQIENKRMFIARDNRKRPIRWSNKSKRRALAVLHPTGNPFLDLCLWKGRFPSRRAQFCTQYLKSEPMNRYQLALADEGYTVISWQGVRRDESQNRKHVLQIEELADDIWAYRPIADWTAQEAISKHFDHNIRPNPLYSKGMSRVGCMPCINANKLEIREIAKRWPEHVERIAEWEMLVQQVSKRGGASFFPNTHRNPFDMPDIHAKIEWAMTSYGGKERDMFADAPPDECASSYGLCDLGGGA